MSVRFECRFCPEIYNEGKEFLEHHMIHMVPNQEEQKLKTKITTESVQNEIQCKTCTKTFKSNQNLDAHYQNVHNKVKDRKCNFCSMTFGNIYHLKRQLKTVHDHTKPHNYKKIPKCDSCNKSFSHDSDLKRHFNLIHENSKAH